ncbi:unnamed protein product [Angiostrongylus costaricensis]|uniref:Transmembrane protein n=1 Tax=Angiostrongylus costaricensis TaxID=334426 RepID=A0A0R3PT42_ANGCS|nr:unnamed protein product [Angiostrongylus costaricensis]
MTELLVSCNITLCHMCDIFCREYTPPRSCRDSLNRDYDRMWNESVMVERACKQPEVTTTVENVKGASPNLSVSSGAVVAIITTLVYLTE